MITFYVNNGYDKIEFDDELTKLVELDKGYIVLKNNKENEEFFKKVKRLQKNDLYALQYAGNTYEFTKSQIAIFDFDAEGDAEILFPVEYIQLTRGKDKWQHTMK